MKSTLNLLCLCILLSILIVSCSTITRTERDVFTITDKDTIIDYHITNHPGNRDMGVIFPSSKVVKPEHEIKQRDSVVERYYPDFIRLGVFEAIGTIGGNPDYAIGTGILGVFPNFSNLDDTYRGDKDNIFSGGIYRLGIAEYRLRWFRDSPNWTIGLSAVEFILPDSRGEKALISIAPLYLRKRFYLSEEIPYLSFTPSVGIGYFPSYYANVSGSLEFGSIGGLNLRAYLGLAAGYNSSSSPQVRDNDLTNHDKGVSVLFPYFGLGVSVLDFHNLVRETETEWKYHEHSAWNIGVAQFMMLSSSADNSIYDENSLFKGFQLKLANASLALPIENNNFFVGTSLASLLVLGQQEYSLNILPIKLGYWHVLIQDELTTEPFIELGYYPSTLINIGTKVNLAINEFFNLGIALGYASGSSSVKLPLDFNSSYGVSKDFSQFYLGINFGLFDRIFNPQELRYYR